MLYDHVMLDIETLGITPGSVILSIGAVAFNRSQPESEWLHFHVTPISVSSSRLAGLTIDDSTLAWWLRQDPEALKLLSKALDTSETSLVISIEDALYDLDTWYRNNAPKAAVWGNGANFDNVLVRTAFDKALGQDAPWPYYMDRCFRTMKQEFPTVVKPPFEGLKHDALADALHQTRWLQRIWSHIPATAQYADAWKDVGK